jgi:glycosyltransferase involved in cell wall biosynthesis
MIHEIHTEYFSRDIITIKNKKVMINNADRIISISESTKKDILKFYPDIPDEKISVIHHGTSYEILDKHENKENYILFIGQRAGYKNFNNFIQAVAPLLLQYDLRLICTGQGFNKIEIELLKSLKISGRIIIKFVKENELLELYSKAYAFVFPSLYEGFGIPILEAFAAGCPAILSNTGSLPEIGGNAAVYFDPNSIQDMRLAIEKVIISPNLQRQLQDAGTERVKHFSWEKCVDKTAQVYKSLL